MLTKDRWRHVALPQRNSKHIYVFKSRFTKYNLASLGRDLTSHVN